MGGNEPKRNQGILKLIVFLWIIVSVVIGVGLCVFMYSSFFWG